MVTKPAKPKPELKDGVALDEYDVLRPLTPEEETEWDAWFLRNKDALNANIDKTREQFARGEFYTQEQVDAELAARRRRRISKRS
jgi:hypothetical protein